MRTRTVCGVSRGDAPLTLRWLKDGEPLPLALGANVTFLDQYSSLLSIPSLSATHSGDYTCVATNPAAEFKYTATLQVKGIVYKLKLDVFVCVSARVFGYRLAHPPNLTSLQHSVCFDFLFFLFSVHITCSFA